MSLAVLSTLASTLGGHFSQASSPRTRPKAPKQKTPSAPCDHSTLHFLPPEIAFLVMYNLRDTDIAAVMQTCKHLNGLGHDEWMWQNKVKIDFGDVPNPNNKSWLEVYKERSRGSWAAHVDLHLGQRLEGGIVSAETCTHWGRSKNFRLTKQEHANLKALMEGKRSPADGSVSVNGVSYFVVRSDGTRILLKKGGAKGVIVERSGGHKAYCIAVHDERALIEEAGAAAGKLAEVVTQAGH